MTDVDIIVVFGDSSSLGFGTGGRSYPVVLAETLGATRLEVSADFGRTTREVLDRHHDFMAGVHPDLIVVQTGMADSLMHPGRGVQVLLERFAPKTWHGVDGLERRAVFSSSRRRRAGQWAASTAKTHLKRALVALTGGHTRMQPEEYGTCLDRLLTQLEAGTALVVSLGPYTIDEHFFPRQSPSTRRFVETRRAVMARHPSVIDVDVDSVIHHWDDFHSDHGHWNRAGHAAVAAGIARRVRASHPVAPSTDRAATPARRPPADRVTSGPSA